MTYTSPFAKDTVDSPAKLKAGEQRFRIFKLVCLGDQPNRDDTKRFRKYYVGLETEDGKEVALSFNGLFNFSGKAQEGFIGFHELFSAVLGREVTEEEETKLDKYETLLDKTIIGVVTETISPNGKTYSNITEVKPSDVQMEGVLPIVAFHKEQIGEAEAMLNLDSRIAELVSKSTQYVEYLLNGTVEAAAEPVEKEIKLSDIGF